MRSELSEEQKAEIIAGIEMFNRLKDTPEEDHAGEFINLIGILHNSPYMVAVGFAQALRAIIQ